MLGANSALPTPSRFSSSFVLNYNHKLFVLDCGEGAQIKMSEYGIRRSKIQHIFITHLHGDHIYGLPGLLTSFNLNGRTDLLNIYGPTGIKDYVEHMVRITGGSIAYPIIYREIEGGESMDLGIIDGLSVKAIPMVHRIPTYGYIFREHHAKRNMKSDAIRAYGLSVEEIKLAQNGADITRDETVIANDKLTHGPKPSRSFAYCTDTKYEPEIVPHVSKVDLLYHEATYLDVLRDKAHERMHATAKEAAQIAHMAGVKKLIIGHYSSRYKDLSPLLDEAKIEFDNTQLAIGGETHSID